VPFLEREPLLFLSLSELIHSRCDTLQFRVFVHVLEVHDYMTSEGSNDDSSDSSGDSSADSLRGPTPSSGSSLCPWPRIYWVASDWISLSRELWPSLPSHGSGVEWALASAAEPS
jgi:hypothetical protein